MILIEGPAELFLVSAFAEKCLDVDLDAHGISLVSIHGTHFDAYAQLFGESCIKKQCAILGDRDLQNQKDDDEAVDPDKRVADLLALESDFVGIFLGDTTLEMEITLPANLKALHAAATELGRVKLPEMLSNAIETGTCDDELKKVVLSTAKSVGKARFAQVLAKHITDECEAPSYISQAVEWSAGSE